MAKSNPDEEPAVPSPEPGPPSDENRPVGTVPKWAHKRPEDIPAWDDHDGDDPDDEPGTRPDSAPTGPE
jgi:hypothetical protein